MELHHILQKLQRELSCSICYKSFLNPMTLTCGHNFCRDCLTNYLGQNSIEAACPQCEEKLPRLNFIPNVQLTNITKLVKQLNIDIMQITAAGPVCKEHPPALKAFCKQELILICSRCSLFQEHLTHDIVTVAEAAEEYKGHLLTTVEALENEKKKVSKHHSDERTQAVTIMKQLERERQFVIAEFNTIRQFLEHQEKFMLLKVMESLEKIMLWKKAKHSAILFREVSTFDEVIQIVKEKCQQSADELLQDVGSTFERCKQTLSCKETFTKPIMLPTWVKFGVLDLFDFNAFLGTLMKQFKDTLSSGFQIQKANVTLDPDTAHPMLILSKDLKSVWLGRESKKLIRSNKRFDQIACVLGHEIFITGRHYWDVAVENQGEWVVGVARRSIKRKGVMAFGEMEGIWAMAMHCGNLMFIKAPVFTFEPNRWEVKKIRVSLNYVGGRVAFSDVERGSLYFAFSGISFSGEPICPFFWIEKNTRLSLCP